MPNNEAPLALAPDVLTPSVPAAPGNDPKLYNLCLHKPVIYCSILVPTKGIQVSLFYYNIVLLEEIIEPKGGVPLAVERAPSKNMPKNEAPLALAPAVLTPSVPAAPLTPAPPVLVPTPQGNVWSGCG